MSLLGLSISELEEFAVEYGQPAFRGRQIYDGLYKKNVKTFDEITSLPKHWRDDLNKKKIEIGRLNEDKRSISRDGTIKLLLSTCDGQYIETVGIPTKNRLTVCLSTQVGCPMGCIFCATGKDGLTRSLTVNEIIDQILSIQEIFCRNVTHVVFMGMGEPLLNIYNVLGAIDCISRDLKIGQRRITLSTVGVKNKLAKLASIVLNRLGRAQFTLAVSLHAPNQRMREELIPSAKSYHLSELINDCKNYFIKTGRRVSFEYILLANYNDNINDAHQLSLLLSELNSHVNLIAYNPIDDDSFKRPSKERVMSFMNYLNQKGINTTLRSSRGLDQNAACGQLRRSKK